MLQNNAGSAFVPPSEISRRGAPLKYGPDRFTSRRRGLRIRDRTKIYLLQAFDEWKTLKKVFEVSCRRPITNGEFANHLLASHKTSGCAACGFGHDLGSESLQVTSDQEPQDVCKAEKSSNPTVIGEGAEVSDKKLEAEPLPSTQKEGDAELMSAPSKSSSSKRKQKFPKSIRVNSPPVLKKAKQSRKMNSDCEIVVQAELETETEEKCSKLNINIKTLTEKGVAKFQISGSDSSKDEGVNVMADNDEEVTDGEEEGDFFFDSDSTDLGKDSSEYEPSEKDSSSDNVSDSEPENDDLLLIEEGRKRRLRAQGYDIPDEVKPDKKKRGPGHIIRRVRWVELLKMYECKMCSFETGDTRSTCLHLLTEHLEITSDLVDFLKKMLAENALKAAQKEATLPEKKSRKKKNKPKEDVAFVYHEEYQGKTLYDLIEDDMKKAVDNRPPSQEFEASQLEENTISKPQEFQTFEMGNSHDNGKGSASSPRVITEARFPSFENAFNLYGTSHLGHDSAAYSLTSIAPVLDGASNLSQYGMSGAFPPIGIPIHPGAQVVPPLLQNSVSPYSAAYNVHGGSSAFNRSSSLPFHIGAQIMQRNMAEDTGQGTRLNPHLEVASQPGVQKEKVTISSIGSAVDPDNSAATISSPCTKAAFSVAECKTVTNSNDNPAVGDQSSESNKSYDCVQGDAMQGGAAQGDADAKQGDADSVQGDAVSAQGGKQIELDPFESREVIALIERWIKLTLHCPYCQIKIRWMKKCDMHRCKRVSPSMLCDVCGKDFPQTYFRFHYRRVHVDLSTAMCQYCGKEMRPQSLSRHIRIMHKPHDLYSCGICKKKFNSKKHRDKHEAIHSTEKPFKCPTCHRGFTQKTNMKNHMRQHTGEQPYKCHNCMKSFTHNVSLKNHLKRYHGIDLWQLGHTGGGRPKKDENN